MIRILLLSVMTAFAACAGPAPPASVRPDPSGYSYVAEEVAPRVRVLRQREPFHVQPRGNVVAIEQAHGVVLIDSGGSPAGAEEVIAHVRGFTRRPVIAIVLTHWHGDHVLGVSRLLREWPEARVISTAATRDNLTRPGVDRFMPGDDAESNARLLANIREGVAYLESEGQNAALTPEERAGFSAAAREYAAYGDTMAEARRAPPNETFTDRLELADARAPVEILFLGRANTDGDAIVWLPRQRVLIAGDVVVSPIPYGFGSYPRDWIEVLRQIEGYDYSVLVPGHGAPMRDRVYVDRLIALLEEVRADAALVANTPDARVDLSEARAGFVGEDAWMRRWFDAYWTQPITASAVKEARGEAIVQGE